MIDKVEAGKTYRLIDKKGWLEHCSENAEFLVHFDTKQEVKVERVTENGAGVVNGDYVIGTGEYKYFELVEEDTESVLPNYWDGESPLEVGMAVIDGHTTVEYIASDGKVVLKPAEGETYYLLANAVTPFDQRKSEKEAAFKEVVDRYRRLSLDNIYVTPAQYKDILDIAWDVFRQAEQEGGE